MVKNKNDPTRIEKGSSKSSKGFVIPGTAPGIDKKNQELLDLLKKHMKESMVREYIRELLTEVAKGPQDLPDSVHIVIDPHTFGKGAAIRYADEDGEAIVATQDGPWGEMFIVDVAGREDTGPCGGAWKLSSVNAGSGWGPMLYDVAMEYATAMGGGLIADRTAVSPEARRVWDYYFTRRGDTEAHQLDDLENTLTPVEEDNCDQEVAGFDVNRPAGGRYSPRKKAGVDWVESPLSKRYTKNPATMDALIALDKLVEL
jgi:hypothetical protein